MISNLRLTHAEAIRIKGEDPWYAVAIGEDGMLLAVEPLADRKAVTARAVFERPRAPVRCVGVCRCHPGSAVVVDFALNAEGHTVILSVDVPADGDARYLPLATLLTNYAASLWPRWHAGAGNERAN